MNTLNFCFLKKYKVGRSQVYTTLGHPWGPKEANKVI